MDVHGRVLAQAAGVIVLGAVDRQYRRGQVLECTRTLDVFNTTGEDVLVRAIVLRAGGDVSAARPACRYLLAQRVWPGGRVTVVDDRVLERVRGQEQEVGAVRPFHGRLRPLEVLSGPPPQVTLQVTVAGHELAIPVPVLQLASDAHGRLFHVPPMA